jgi:hypothetical protein
MYGVRTQRDCTEIKDTLKAHLTSPWVQEFIRKRGGVPNVAWWMVCRG